MTQWGARRSPILSCRAGTCCFIRWVWTVWTTEAMRAPGQASSDCGKGAMRCGLRRQQRAETTRDAMLLFREKVPADWLPKVLANLPAVLVDHAHLERKAATTALNLEKFRDLFPRVEELNAIAIEELQHFQLVLNLLKRRGIPFGQPIPSPWISAFMRSIRNGPRSQSSH